MWSQPSRWDTATSAHDAFALLVVVSGKTLSRGATHCDVYVVERACSVVSASLFEQLRLGRTINCELSHQAWRSWA